MTGPAPDHGLAVADLVDEAATRAGPWEGPVPFAATLELLVASCLRTGALNAVGLQVLHKAGVRHLRNLRYLHDHVEAHPEVAGRDLGAPIVVTGLPRTGTTVLHNLLAVDPAHRTLRFWEALHPVPPGAGGPSEEDLQAQAARWLDAFNRLVPQFRAIHRATPTGPEECDALLQNTFASQHFDDMFDAEEYSEWLATAALTQEYEHYALQLRVLTTPATAGPTWALKSPSHLGHLDALRRALPGCTVVMCHRDPRRAVASHASLIQALRRAYSDRVTPCVLGRQALARATKAMGRALAVRDTTDGSGFVDVSYDRLARDPIGAARDVYAALGRELEVEVEDRMRRWIDANPQHGHGPHRYDPNRFGLAGGDVEGAFELYLERFGALASD